MRQSQNSLATAPPKLSVIVPVHNERRLVAELLRQLAAAPMPSIGRREVIVVDDGSTDGSAEIVRRLAGGDGGMRLIERPDNRGKGAALRAGIAAAGGDLIVFQDADLEYDPRDLETLARALGETGADAVYGSRFGRPRGRRFPGVHELGNRLITAWSNLFTGLGLSDVETCYKMLRAPLVKAMTLRSNDFAIEVEVTARLARRGARVVEVPIGYRGRSRHEGKKITWRDGVRALIAVVRFRFDRDG